MRIAFLNPPVWVYTGLGPLNFNPNLGIMMLAAVLEKKGHEVKCFDAECLRWTYDMCITALKDFQPESVGITGTTLGWPSMKEMTLRIKKATNGKCRVVLGGPHVSHDPARSKFESGADCVVGKEAETLIEDAMTGDSAWGEPVPGVMEFQGYVDLSELPWPARHLNVPSIRHLYSGNAPRYEGLETCVNWQRGCPHSCSYCSHTVYGNRPIRHRKASDIVDELVHLKLAYGVQTVFVYDDELIGVSKKQNEWLHGVLDAIIQADLGLNFKTQGRCNKKLVKPNLLAKMKQAGFRCLMLGCESGSEAVLRAMNKKTTPEDIYHTVRMVHEAGIDTFCFWMVGNLEETVDEVKLTEMLMLDLKLYTTWKQVTICTPWVGSRVHKAAEEGKWFLTEDPVQWLADRPAMKTPWMTPEEMITCRSRLLAV